MRPPLCLVFFMVCQSTVLGQSREIAHPLFDANHCLQGFETSPAGDTVEFYWGCGAKKYLTMECVYDKVGYLDQGESYAPAGWHCNWPLAPLSLGGKKRIADVAVRSAGEEKTWAACFVDSYGDPSSRKKPYHETACYRVLLKIHGIVTRTQRDPRDVAKELPQQDDGNY